MSSSRLKNKKSVDIKLYSEAKTSVKVSFILSTFFFTGLLPIAPGTWGSLFSAIAIFIFLPTTGLTYLIVCFAIFIAGAISADNVTKFDGIEDNPRVVIDEVLGMALAVAYLPKILSVYILAFIIFRVLDIMKPPPIGYLDKRVKGGMGVMLDDIAAGLFTNVILSVLIILEIF